MKVNGVCVLSTGEVIETVNSRNWLRRKLMAYGDSKPRDWKFYTAEWQDPATPKRKAQHS